MTHVNAFVGPTNHTLNFSIQVATLTTKEIDVDGCLKPNVPFDENGALIGDGLTTAAVPVAASSNTGNGTVTAILGKAGKPSENITLRALSPTTFSVVGSRSGRLGNATVGTPYTSAAINFTINAGGTAFVVGDIFDIVLTGKEAVYVYGATIEATKIVDKNPTNASLAADNRKVPATVATQGQINRSIARDVLGRDYTAAEIAAFKAPGSRITLTRANS